MFDTILGLGFLGAIGVLLWSSFRQMRKTAAEQEAEYWKHECAMLQYENQFLRGLEQRLVPRLLQQFGADFQDFMIERTLRQHSGIAMPAPPPAQREMTIQTYNPMRPPKGYNISHSNFVQSNDDADSADEITESCGFETEYSDYCHTEMRRELFRQSTTQSSQDDTNHVKTLPFGAKGQPQAPISSQRKNRPLQLAWHDDDVIDAEYIEIPVLPLFTQPENKPQPRKGGRPKKYATDAERQAAYRARQIH